MARQLFSEELYPVNKRNLAIAARSWRERIALSRIFLAPCWWAAYFSFAGLDLTVSAKPHAYKGTDLLIIFMMAVIGVVPMTFWHQIVSARQDAA